MKKKSALEKFDNLCDELRDNNWDWGRHGNLIHRDDMEIIFERYGWEKIGCREFYKKPIIFHMGNFNNTPYIRVKLSEHPHGNSIACVYDTIPHNRISRGGEWVFWLNDSLEKVISRLHRRQKAMDRLAEIYARRDAVSRVKPIDDDGLFSEW